MTYKAPYITAKMIFTQSVSGRVLWEELLVLSRFHS